MAELLKRQYDLLSLKIRLDTAGEEPLVHCALEVTLHGQLHEQLTWVFSTEAFGLPSRIDRRRALYRGYDFQIPAPLSAQLKDWLATQSSPDVPLWIHLVTPYGYLAMVPWERLLQPDLGVPLLRLPEFLVAPPLETPSTLDVLLCSSGPAAKEEFRVVDHLRNLARRLRDAVPRRTRFHVFTDKTIGGALRDKLKEDGFAEPDLVLYGAESAEQYGVPKGGTNVPEQISGVDNPWLLWMRDSVRSRSIDVAHFVCHGYLSRDRGALAFAESPLRNSDTHMARFVGSAELGMFLTQVGAWATVFSSPEHNYSQMGLRQLAEAIAQSRPGPVVHHDLELDNLGYAMAAAYQLLFSRSPQPAPASPALSIHCQPFRVLRPATHEPVAPAPSAADEIDQSPELDSVFETSENVPPWVAVSTRYLEQCKLNIKKMRPDSSDQEPDPERMHAADDLSNTLRQIQAVVARVASTTKPGGGQ